MACESTTADNLATTADALTFAFSSMAKVLNISPIAAVPISHLAIGATALAVSEEIHMSRDEVPMNFLGTEVKVNADYVGFVSSIAAAAEITALAAGITVGSTVGLAVTGLGIVSFVMAGASNDKVRDIATDPKFWSAILAYSQGATLPLRNYIKNYKCKDPLEPIRKKFSDAQKIVSPIALDLNGDGITTTDVEEGTYFDHDANGFAEQTGWVNSQDGILVLDRNSNGTIDSGRELFGSETLLANGQKAANGYQALGELDTNQDGQINQQDTAYTTLKIWKDANGDGYSSAGELLTLADAGVQSIATGYIDVNQTDANGNITQQTGTFTKTDGSTGASADIWFQVNKTHTIATDWLPETTAVAALPDLQGFGNVRDLHQAMLRDNRGQLQEFCDATNDVMLEMKRAG